MITGYSLIIAILLFNLALAAIALLQKRTWYLARFGTSALVLLMFLGAVRLFLPISIPPVTNAIQSFVFLPRVVAILRMELMPGVEVQAVLLALWGIGSATVFLRLMLTFRRLRKLKELYDTKCSDNSHAVQTAEKLGLKHYKIVVSPYVGAPFVTGVFRALIYLPELDLPDSEFEMILRHEYQHFKQCDFLVKGFYNMLSIVFWWNPFVHYFHRNLDRLLEVRCDAAVKKLLTNDEKATYIGVLYRIMRHAELNGITNLPAKSSSSAFVLSGEADYENFVEQRFRLIASGKGSAKMQIISIALVMTVFSGSFLFVVQPHGEPPSAEVADASRISPEVQHIVITADGRYELFENGEFVIELPEIPEIFADLPVIVKER
ncbi:MAG: M56 family metallopeptidase [Oscillospiraceae bacterium]|nr:M56 family metallopeptidase [Oscillospiraceae bacterium]